MPGLGPTRRWPLWNGETDVLNDHPHPDGPFMTNPLETDFVEESNPSWLTLDADGTQTFSGLASASGKGTTTLNTGAATDNISLLETDAVDWNDFKELFVWMWGASISDNNAAQFFVSYGDNRDPGSITEGVYWLSNTNQGVDFDVVTGGTSQASNTIGGDRESPRMWGLRVFEHPDNANSAGHEAHWYYDWEPQVRHEEADGFPAAGEHPFRFGIKSADGSDQPLTIDGIYVEAVPK